MIKLVWDTMKNLRNILSLIGALTVSSTLSAFIIINDTDVEQVLKLQEMGKRPQPTAEKPVRAPKPYNKRLKIVTVPAHSTVECSLTLCYFLNCGFVTMNKKGNTTTTHTSTRLYGPDDEETQITTHWGLVVYKTPQQSDLDSMWERFNNDPYSARLLTPDEIEKK